MNFSKVGILIILLGLSLLSACGQIPITFSGESDNWSVHYEITEHDGKCRETSGYINYIGNEPIPKVLEYSLSNSTGTAPLDKHGNYTMTYGCTNANEDTEIEAILKWDSKSETIPLIVE